MIRRNAKGPMSRRLLVLLRETFVPSLLVALLSGPIAASFLVLGACALELRKNLFQAPGYVAAWSNVTLAWSDFSMSLMVPVLGLIGSFALWKTTLSFGFVSALAQHWAGPSRRTSMVVGAIYGGVWAVLCRIIHVAEGSAWIRAASLIEDVAVSIAIGTIVGRLLPWRYLIRSWWEPAEKRAE